MTLIQLFKAIADAIRTKKGTTDKIKAEDFATEIENIGSIENLDDVLNAQDVLLNNQGLGLTDIENALQRLEKGVLNE